MTQTQPGVNAPNNSQPANGGQTEPQPADAAGVETKPVEPLKPESSDRTKEQFDKLLDSNKRLFEANELLRKEMKTRTNANASITPTDQVAPLNQPQKVEEINPQDFVEKDPVTGEQYINEKKLKDRMADIQSKATRAEEAVNSYIKTAEEREVDRQNKEAFAAYPELQPDAENFDTNMHRQVRGVLYDSMLNADEYGGRPLSFKEAADFISKQLTPKTKEQTPAKTDAEPADQKSTDGQALKEQSAAQAVSQPQNAPPEPDTAELRELQMATRYGDDTALAQRLMHTEHIVPKEGSSDTQT